MNRTRWNGPNFATNKNRFAKRNQNCDVTKRNRRSQNNPILQQQLLNNAISLQSDNEGILLLGVLHLKLELFISQYTGIISSGMFHSWYADASVIAQLSFNE